MNEDDKDFRGSLVLDFGIWRSHMKTIYNPNLCTFINFSDSINSRKISTISKIQLVVYYQCYVLIGLATSRLFVIAH